MNKNVLRFFHDKELTKEAETVDFEGSSIPVLFNKEPLMDKPEQEVCYVKFQPPRPTLLFVPDGQPQVSGDLKLVESNIPRQMRAGDVGSIIVQWTLKQMTLETLAPYSGRIDISGCVVTGAER